MAKQIDPLKVITDAPKPVVDHLTRHRDSAVKRFPLLFTMLATFGVVATLYGFQRLIDKVDWLSRNPVVMLVTGVIVLLITGTLYKKL